MNSCLGGQSSVRLSPQKRIGQSNIIWNNCEIRIDNKPVHYKNYYEAGIVFTQDLLFNLNVADAYNHLSNKIGKADPFTQNNAPVSFKIVPELLRIRAVEEKLV